jgi:hypothetical protein
VQFVGVLQVFAFWQTLAQPSLRWRTALVLLSVTLFYLHYTASLLFVAQGVYFALAKSVWPSETRYSLRQMFCDTAIVVLACAPATIHLLAIADHREAWWKFVRPKPFGELATMFSLLFTVAVPLVVLLVCRGVRWWRNDNATPLPLRPLALACLWLFVPLVLAWSATQFEWAALWLRRYVMVSAAAPLVIAGVACGGLGKRWLQCVAALAIALASTWAVVWGPHPQLNIDGRIVNRSLQDWRAATAMIRNDQATAHWPVLVRSGFIEADRRERDALLRAYLLSPVTTIYKIDHRERELVPLAYSLPAKLNDGDVENLAKHGGFWLITPGNAKTKDAAMKGVRLSLERVGPKSVVEQAADFGGVWVVKMRITDKP